MPQSASRWFCLAVLVFLLAAIAAGQVTSTGIHGIVKDASGAVIPRVDLTLIDMATQSATTARSQNDGGFVFVNIPAGSYRLTATASGFQTAVLDGVVVDSGRTLDLTVQLQVAPAPTGSR